MTHNSFPSKNILHKSGAVLAATAATLALTACVAEQQPNIVPTTPSVSATELPSALTPTVDPEQKIQDELNGYISSDERNHTIEGVVDQLGARVIKHGPKVLGYFDFYNPRTKKWKYNDNAGWGYFQHNPGYGGSKYQVSVGAYQNASGKIDAQKGIQELSVDIPGTNTFIEFTGPNADNKFLSKKGPAGKGWTVAIVDMNKIKTNEDGRDAWEKVDGNYDYQTDPESVPDADAARAIDTKAMALAENAVDDLLKD